MPSLRITVIQTLWYKVNIMTLMNCNNWNSPIKKSVCLFLHINSWSLNKNFEEPQNLLQSINIHFDVIAITETRITNNTSVTQIIELSNYSFEHTPREPSVGGTHLYIANHLSYKTRSGLNIYKNWIRTYFCWSNQPKSIKHYCWHHLQTSKNGCDWI